MFYVDEVCAALFKKYGWILKNCLKLRDKKLSEGISCFCKTGKIIKISQKAVCESKVTGKMHF